MSSQPTEGLVGEITRAERARTLQEVRDLINLLPVTEYSAHLEDVAPRSAVAYRDELLAGLQNLGQN